jgi:hypothetical protein
VPDFKRRAMTGRFRIAAGVLAAATAVAVSVIFAALPSSATPLAGSAIPAPAIGRLTSTARAIAKGSGDSTPTSVLAVITTHAKALTAATPGDTVPQGANQPVYLVVMKGRFAAHVPVPPGVHVPTVTYLSLVFNAATFRVTDMGLGWHAPPVSLRNFGPVTKLRVAQPH